MNHAFEMRGVTRRFGDTVALNDVSLGVPEGSVVGLVGRNGSGKTTLLHTAVGLILPDEGTCTTLGRDTAGLGADELGAVGFVPQESRFLAWMSVRQHLRYVAAFHEGWDADLERRLIGELELDEGARCATLSPGNQQKLAILLAVCHRPRLLVLDEPVSAMDPIAREQLLHLLLELLHEDGTSIVLSSHVLRDVERVVDRIACLDAGRVVADEELDVLKETYARWRVTSTNGWLPASFPEEWIVEQEVEAKQARLSVRAGEDERAAFTERWHATVEVEPLNLERIFPLLIAEREQ